MNHVANIPKKKSLNSFRPSTSRIPVSEMVCKSVLSLTSECQSIPQGSLHCYVLGRKDSEVWPVVLGWNFTDPYHWDSWVPVIMGIPLGWKTKMFVLLMAWGRYRGQVTEGWGRTFGPGHTDARRRMTARTWKGHHTVWRSQEDSLVLRILQTVDFCPTCNTEYNMILNVNKKQTVKAHIISQRVFHEPFLIFFSKG